MRTAILCLGLGLAGCGGAPASATDGGVDADPSAGATTLEVPVPASGRAYVRLAEPQVVTPSDPASTEWDLAFEGFDVFTNSGVSGPGAGGAFGALDALVFASDSAPVVPFLSVDKAGGAFLDWYAYDGANHVLFSRFHVYGVRRGERLWKIQLLTYYGLADGAPTSALYQLRYAELGASDSATQTIDVDGTAGGLSAPASAPSGCLSLATGTVTQLAPETARTQGGWDLCFRRDTVSVDGEVGGPDGVGAVDLDAAATAGEQLADVQQRTAESEQGRFDAATAASFTGRSFRGDHVVSAFESGGWVDLAASPPRPSPNQAYLVADATGQHLFLVGFVSFQNATTSSPGTVVLQIKPVQGEP